MRHSVPPRLDFQLGERDSFSKTITESDVTTFAGLVGDFNPLHVDAEYARRSRFGRRTAHSILVAGLISAVLNTQLPGPGMLCLSLHLEFLAPTYIGDTITAVVEVAAWDADKRLLTLKTDCVNQNGVQIVAGQAVMAGFPPSESTVSAHAAPNGKEVTAAQPSAQNSDIH